MKWKGFAKDYLHFTRKERIAVLILVALIFGLWLLPAFIPKTRPGGPVMDTALTIALNRLERQQEGNPVQEQVRFNKPSYKSWQGNGISQERRAELFYFDPNTLDEGGWKKLGLRDKTIGTIRNYLNKGGKFRTAEDLARIYGLFPDEYERIAPYVKIEGQETNRLPPFPGSRAATATSPKKITAIDINLADTSAFIALPGIGSKLAARIVNFRDKLGGFYSIEQVGETFGLADSVFQKIKPFLNLGSASFRMININTAGADELKTHPYIRSNIASAIVSYRKEHGDFKSVNDLQKIMAVTDDIFKKLMPYLSI